MTELVTVTNFRHDKQLIQNNYLISLYLENYGYRVLHINATQEKDAPFHIPYNYAFNTTTIESIISKERPLSSLFFKMRHTFHYFSLQQQLIHFEQQAKELGHHVGALYQYVLLQTILDHLDETYDYIVIGVDASDDLYVGNALFACTNEISLVERDRLTNSTPSHFNKISQNVQLLKNQLQLPITKRKLSIVQHPERLRQFLKYEDTENSFPFTHPLFASFRSEIHEMITQNIEEMVLSDYKKN